MIRFIRLSASLFITTAIVSVPLLCGSISAPMNKEITAACALIAALCLITAISALKLRDVNTIGVASMDIAVTMAIIYISVRILLTDTPHRDNTVFITLSTAMAFYVLSRISTFQNIIVYGILISTSIQAMVVIGQWLGWLPGGNIVYPCTGSFDNPSPAACFIATGILMGLRLSQRYKSLIVIVALQLFALWLLDSKSAFVGLIAGILYLIYRSIHVHRWITSLILIGITIFCALFINSPSATGRLMIWEISLSMIFRNPTFGLGEGAFHRQYMLAQAQYFTARPDSPYIAVADNIIYPFNDFVGITIEYGIIGLLLTIVILALVFSMKDMASRFITSAVVVIMVFACFSYPLESLPLILLTAILIGQYRYQPIFLIKLDWRKKISIMIVSVSGIIVSFLENGELTRLNNAMSTLYISGRDIDNSLYNKFIGNKHFNDFYMTYLSRAGTMASNPRILDAFPSCENLVMAGQFHAINNNFKSAEFSFYKAIAMLPNRVRPRYELWKLYVENSMPDKAVYTAGKIVEMNEKVESTYTLAIKRKMRLYLNEPTTHNQETVSQAALGR